MPSLHRRPKCVPMLPFAQRRVSRLLCPPSQDRRTLAGGEHSPADFCRLFAGAGAPGARGGGPFSPPAESLPRSALPSVHSHARVIPNAVQR